MAKKGRPGKVVVSVTQQWGIGFDSLNYSIERFIPATGEWRPVSWYGTIEGVMRGFMDRQIRTRALELFGEGVTKLKEEAVSQLLKEVSEDGRRLRDRLQEHLSVVDTGGE